MKDQKLAQAMQMLKDAMELVEMALEGDETKTPEMAEEEMSLESETAPMDKKGLVLSMMKKKGY